MAVADWVEKQDASNSLMPGAIRRFNIMPPIPISRESAEKIASLKELLPVLSLVFVVLGVAAALLGSATSSALSCALLDRIGCVV